ncbi:Outer membrane protein assembly factor BamA precursor [Gimesia panareensis]|uniref:Outer membrane protein assembly factor BamA n=1 Tax=Gimesia panareensis TaxID=2527978 RepID=A0A518FP05_9PLAN|nr:Outer membrane protein assembly factor BamA precursor [Gimesia panareensis]
MIRGVSSDTRCGNALRWALSLILVQIIILGDCINGFVPLIESVCAQEAEKRSINLKEPIFDVRVEGNESIPALSILQKTKIQRGRPATRDMVLEDVRLLFATRWFSSVVPVYRKTEQGLVLVYKVKERPIVEKVEFRGYKKIKLKRLEATTGLKVGSPFDIAANQESVNRIKQLYVERGYRFAEVKLLKGGDPEDRQVIFEIKEGPKVVVSKIKFRGNKFVSDGVLKTKLQTKKAPLGISFLGGKFDPATIQDDLLSLKQYYNGLGFFDVKIEEKVGYNNDKSRVQIEYTINEGKRYKIRDIMIEGNRLFSEDEIREDINLVAGEYFNSRTLAKDVDKLTTRYGELGHLFAKVTPQPRFLETPGEVDLVYSINEDKPYRIRKITAHISGDNPRTKSSVLLNPMMVAPGDLANQRLIAKSKRRIEGNQVFMKGPQDGPRINVTRVDPNKEMLASRENDVLRGQNADEQPTQKLRYPNLRYRNKTYRQTPPQRNQDLFEGLKTEPVSYESPQPQRTGQIFRGQNYDNGIPEPLNPLFGQSPLGDPMGTEFPQQQPGWVDLDVYASESRTGRLMFGVGVNSNAGVVGSIVLQEENFDILRPPRSMEDILDGTAWRGGGQRFRAEAVPGNQVSRYLVNWTDPYFLDTNFSLGVSGFYFTRYYTDWNEQRVGGRFSLGRQLTQEWSVNTQYRLESVKLYNPRSPTPAIVQASVGDNMLNTFRISLNHDTRDAAFLPAEGHLLEWAAEQAVGEYTYSRLEANGSQYFTLYKRPDGGGRHILSLSAQLGWTDTDTPVFERYYAGGFQTFRGFRFRGVTPRENGIAIGGRWSLLGSAQYMMPITADEMIQMVFFSDFGTVDEDVSLDQFRVSVGAGLRLTVPAMGPVPVALDFSVPLAKESFDQTQVFSFYVGFTR